MSDSGTENDSFSSTSSCSSPYWKYVDSILLKCKEKIKQEKQLINEVHYSLSDCVLQVSTGISAARGFEPTVKFNNSVDAISLMDLDWYDFIANIDITPDNDKEKKFVETIVEFENFTISSQLFIDHHLLLLKSGDSVIHIDDNCIKKLINIKHLINYRLEFLRHLDFKNFYNNTILYISNFDKCDKETYIDKIKNLCTLNKCEQSYCLLEYLEFNKNVVVDDIDKIQM